MPNHREVRIFCPKCRWEPRPANRWSCVCRCAWNTFDTGGVCPDCGKAWEQTQCLACHRWSPHGDWYHEFVGDESQREEHLYEPATVAGFQENTASRSAETPSTGSVAKPPWKLCSPPAAVKIVTLRVGGTTIQQLWTPWRR